MQHDVIAIVRSQQFLPECGVCGVARAVNQTVVVVAGVPEVPYHREDRRDADAAGNKKIVVGRHQHKLVLRLRDPVDVADLRLVDEHRGHAASIPLRLDAELVVLPIRGIVAQGILAPRPGRRDQRQVGTGLEGRQFTAAFRCQDEQMDVFGKRLLLNQTKSEKALVVHRQCHDFPVAVPPDGSLEFKVLEINYFPTSGNGRASELEPHPDGTLK